MAQLLDIWNQAISHLGEAVEIQSPTEATAHAKACNRFWDTARLKVLRDCRWTFAKKYALLTLQTVTLPVTEFRFAYQYPADCIFFRRILNTVWRVEDMQTRIPYRIMGKLILTDLQNVTAYLSDGVTVDPANSIPWGEYTIDVSDTTQYPPDFVDALSMYLALRIAPRLARDKRSIMNDIAVSYLREIYNAQRNILNEEAKDDDNVSEFERARIGWPPSDLDNSKLFLNP